MASKEDLTSLKNEMDEGFRFRSRASSDSARSDKFVMPSSNEVERLTPIDNDDDRMSVASSTAKCSLRGSQKLDAFEKECSYESSPSHTENKLDLAMVPVISDQLLYDIVNKERSIEQIDVYLFVKKSLDLLSAKNAAELKVEQLKQRTTELELEIRNIRESKVKMQVRVEQEEEYISNMLLKRIQKLKTDKELLALKYEQEEEFLTNDLMRKLSQLEGERDELATRLSKDQGWVVNNLLVKIRKLEAEIQSNHKSLEQLRREKVDLENSLEHEQEALFNKIGKRMDQLEAEKRRLQTRLDEIETGRPMDAAEPSPSTSSLDSGRASSTNLALARNMIMAVSTTTTSPPSQLSASSSGNNSGGGNTACMPTSSVASLSSGIGDSRGSSTRIGSVSSLPAAITSNVATPSSPLETSTTSSIGGGSLSAASSSGIGSMAGGTSSVTGSSRTSASTASIHSMTK